MLTGRLAYPARSFSQLNDAWSRKPPPPSAFASDIPHQLDALVMSMLSLEAALRPRHASEVMLQLATLLGTSDDEVADVSRAYLSTPSLTGRNDLMQWFRRRIARAPLRGGSSLVIEGGIGMGRTRALEACVTLAQTQGCIVVRASGSALDARPFATAQRLTEQLAGQLPVTCLEVARASRIAELLFEPPAAMGTALPAPLRVCGFDAGIVDRGTMQEALSKLFFEVARSRVVLIAVDDLERVDEPTQAWLATLAVRARKHKILVVFSMLSAGGNQQPASRVIARRSSHYALAPLSHVESEALLMSAFGDVPHVAMVAARIYNIAQGSPSATMALARHLIANASVSYRGGTWVMPARLSIHDLPRSVDEALTTRVNAMSPAARQLGELHAVCIFGALSSADQCLLMCQDDSQLLPARAELLALNALVEDGGRFAVANERWRSALLGGLDGAVGAQRHRALGTLGMQTQRPQIASAYHLFSGGAPVQALDVLRPILRAEIDEMSIVSTVPADRAGQVLSWALRYGETHGSPRHELADLRRWLCTISIASDDAFYHLAASALLIDLRRDSGLEDWEAQAASTSAALRFTAALTRANERYLATPETERVYSVPDAIKRLVQFVVVSIAIGTRTLNAAILSSLPALLEPFVTLSPVIEAMYENALATRECGVQGRYTRARVRWATVYGRLANVSRENLPYVDAIRSAIVYGLGCLEAARGLPAAEERAALLEADPMHRVNAMYLRRVLRLQLGDFDGAERYRRKAELLAVQLNSRQMFTTMLLVELAAYVTARDLTAAREIAQRMAELANHAEGWRVYKSVADGCVRFLRGDLEGARATLEAALTQCWPNDSEPLRALGAMPFAAGVLLEVLNAQHAHWDAQDFGTRALKACMKADIWTIDEIERELALADAKLGDCVGAAARLDGLIAHARAQGVTGLHLGSLYEARARVAIWSRDALAVDEYSRLTALEYRHGRSSPLGARYERLMSEARKVGLGDLSGPSAFEVNVLGTTTIVTAASARARVERAVRDARSETQRAGALAALLAETVGANAAHLYAIIPDGSLRWVASRAESTPGDVENAIAQECLARAFDDDFGSTEVLSTTGTNDTDRSCMWTDPRPHQRAMLLTSSNGDELRRVGVVVFGELSELPASHPIFAEVATQMAQMQNHAQS